MIIGIVAVTLMGTAINGINTGFNRSMALLGDDILYVSKVPWSSDEDDWKFRNRREIKVEYADRLQTIIDATPARCSSRLCRPPTRSATSCAGSTKPLPSLPWVPRTNYVNISKVDLREGRFFNNTESRGGRNVCVLGCDVADALFPERSAIGQTVQMADQAFRVVGIFVKQGSFLGLFSFDDQIVLPLNAFRKYFSRKDSQTDIRVKVVD